MAKDFRFRRLTRKASANRLVSAAERGVRGLFAISIEMERLAIPVKLRACCGKVADFADNNMLQVNNLARILFAWVKPPKRNARGRVAKGLGLWHVSPHSGALL